MSRHTWSDSDRSIMREHYPHQSSHQVAKMIGVSVRKVYAMAKNMGLQKSQAYIDAPESGRFLKGKRRSQATEFKPGHVPANKGKKMDPAVYEKCAGTMFKPGRPAEESRNYKPIGSLRITRDGQLERKITDDPTLYPARRWKPVARLVWEAAHGAIPKGHIVRFKDGTSTTVESEITLDRLECLSKTENMRRNTIHNLPPEIADTCRLIGRVNRQINKRERLENQN